MTLEFSHPNSMIDFVDCKYKCHPQCEDDILDQCTGPKIEKSSSVDQWNNSKHLHHDAVSI